MMVQNQSQAQAQVMSPSRTPPPAKNEGASSSSNMCHMAKGMDNNISDDDSDSPSIKDLLDLIHEHQRVIRKQSKEIKHLNALNDLNASLATNYEDLL